MNRKHFIFLFSILISTFVFAEEINDEQLTDEKLIEQDEQNLEEETFFKKELQKNFNIVIGDHLYNLNPQESQYSVEAQILTGLYEGLFTYDPVTLNPEYAIAKDYRISRDKKRWTFILRDDAKFSDGNRITSETVRNSWINLLKNKNAPFSSLFDIIQGAEAFRNGKGNEEDVAIYSLDDETLSIHLTAPQAHLPKILCMPSFAITSNNENVYSGPFVLESITPLEIVLCKNQNYYDFKKVPLEKITFTISSDRERNAYFFNTGYADWVNASIDVNKVIAKDSAKISAEFATEYLFFKKNGNIWDNAEFRSALLEAVPWDTLRKDTFVQATTLVYPISNYPAVQGYVYTDKAEAISLMKQLRKENHIEDEETLKLTFAINDSERQKEQAELLKDAWKELGVDVEIKIVENDDYLSQITSIDADLFSYTWIGDFADPLAFLELFRGNSTLNVSGWNNEEYNRLLEEASLHSDEEHSKLLSKAEQILLDEAVILPIQHPVSLNVIDLNAVGGWALNSFDIHPLKYLFKKETKPNLPNVVMR